MTSETPNLHVSKSLNISKTKQDIEKLKTPLRLVWKCCSVVFKIGSKIFPLQWHFNFNIQSNMHCMIVKIKEHRFDALDFLVNLDRTTI